MNFFKFIFFERIIIFIFLTLFISCDLFNNKNTYLVGKILKKTNDKISVLKDEKIINETLISENGNFLLQLDSIKNGLYNFKHLPEFQYLILENGDSLVLRLNALDFDESLVFNGVGASKNNYLIDIFLNHEKEEDFLNTSLKENPMIFKKNIDSLLNFKINRFNDFKKTNSLNNISELILEYAISLPLYSKIETYLSIYKQTNRLSEINNEFYEYRNNIDLNIEELSNFKPYLDYIVSRTINESGIDYNSYSNLALQFNLDRIKFVDKTISNTVVKSKILRYIAFEYLLKENLLIDIDSFLNIFLEISEDKMTNLEIEQLYLNITALQEGNFIPNIKIIDNNFKTISNRDFYSNKSIIYVFWSYEQNSHQMSLFNRIFRILNINKNYNFLCININSNKKRWIESLKKIKSMNNIHHFMVYDFKSMSKKMILNNLNKVILTDNKGEITSISDIMKLENSIVLD
tara:strand:- start:120 stop:1508 length:1389 start_codon:yes stop_codon:yes gene_type:complete